MPLAGPEAKFLRRAAFLKHNLWVTAYSRDEKYPGGEFPNQNPRVNEGLATWVKQNRPLEESDIVLWLVPLIFMPIFMLIICTCTFHVQQRVLLTDPKKEESFTLLLMLNF